MSKRFLYGSKKGYTHVENTIGTGVGKYAGTSCNG
jgi:hypothetical protein